MKLINALFCDDIRFEAGNKLSLMGLYCDKIIYSQNTKLPTIARLAILLKFKLGDKDAKPDSFEFKYFIKDKVLVNVKGKIQSNISNNNMQLVINAEGIMLEEGDLGYSIDVLDEKHNTLLATKDAHALRIIAGH